MDVQRHRMAAADEDQRRNHVHKYTTGLHPRHPLLYTAMKSNGKFNKTIKVQGLQTFKDPKSSGTKSFRENLFNQNRTNKKYIPIKEPTRLR